jgi:hypothetical protein
LSSSVRPSPDYLVRLVIKHDLLEHPPNLQVLADLMDPNRAGDVPCPVVICQSLGNCSPPSAPHTYLGTCAFIISRGSGASSGNHVTREQHLGSQPVVHDGITRVERRMEELTKALVNNNSPSLEPPSPISPTTGNLHHTQVKGMVLPKV